MSNNADELECVAITCIVLTCNNSKKTKHLNVDE